MTTTRKLTENEMEARLDLAFSGAEQIHFQNKDEADAFRGGIDYLRVQCGLENLRNSSITVEGPELTADGWTLTIHKQDGTDKP